MNITDYFVVFYAKNKPIADFDFSKFNDEKYYIIPFIKGGKYRSIKVSWNYDNNSYVFNIPFYDYYVYWPISLLRLYNRLVFHHNIKSPPLMSGNLYHKIKNYYHYYEIPNYYYSTGYFTFNVNRNTHIRDKFRKRFKAIIVMK